MIEIIFTLKSNFIYRFTHNNLEKELKIYSKINFTKTSKLNILAVKSEDSLLVEGTTDALEKFNYRYRPAFLNGIKDNYSADIVIESDNIGNQSSSAYFENTSSENEFSKHFKKELSQEIINLAHFNLKRNIIDAIKNKILNIDENVLLNQNYAHMH